MLSWCIELLFCLRGVKSKIYKVAFLDLSEVMPTSSEMKKPSLIPLLISIPFTCDPTRAAESNLKSPRRIISSFFLSYQREKGFCSLPPVVLLMGCLQWTTQVWSYVENHSKDDCARWKKKRFRPLSRGKKSCCSRNDWGREERWLHRLVQVRPHRCRAMVSSAFYTLGVQLSYE